MRTNEHILKLILWSIHQSIHDIICELFKHLYCLRHIIDVISESKKHFKLIDVIIT